MRAHFLPTCSCPRTSRKETPGLTGLTARPIPRRCSEAVKRAARLGKPIYIMENGVPDAEDQIRPWLIVNVLRELHRSDRGEL